jgi:XisH protein
LKAVPAKNAHHDTVIAALVTDGWSITHDPLSLKVGNRVLHVDLGAEKLPIGAERAGEKIAVEIQSFASPSPIADLQQALGQFEMYRLILADQEPDRVLFLAVTATVYDGILSEEIGRFVLTGASVRLVVFDPERAEVVRWTK